MRTSGSVQTVPVPCAVVVDLYKTIRTPPKYSRRLCLGDEVTNPDMDLLINQKLIDCTLSSFPRMSLLIARVTGMILDYAVPDGYCDRRLALDVFNRAHEKLSESVSNYCGERRSREIVARLQNLSYLLTPTFLMMPPRRTRVSWFSVNWKNLIWALTNQGNCCSS